MACCDYADLSANPNMVACCDYVDLSANPNMNLVFLQWTFVDDYLLIC